MDDEEILRQKIKMLEEENANLRAQLEVPKINESFATTPTHQMIAPTTQRMDREKENSKSGNNYCCLICCISDDSNRSSTNNRDCCCCCCEGGGDCEGGCDD